MAGSYVSPGEDDDLWIFGYGSLIFRPDFSFEARREGYITGWVRRLWQASLDHRGTPELPGRVATLVHSPGSKCWGVAYRIASGERAQVLRYLDARESGGYQRRHLAFCGPDHPPLASVLVYIADQQNPNYVGPEATEVTAARVRAARGLTGDNLEYVLRLAAALDAMGADDPHVQALVDWPAATSALRR